MSGLAGLLAGHHAAGVYQWHAAYPPADVRHRVEHVGWTFGHVDGWVHQDKAGVLAAVGEALAFPEWYGANLDALADCLRDLATPTVLLWDGWGTLAREDRAAFDALVDVFAARAADRAHAFSVLLRGDGPVIAVPSLDV